MQGIQFSVSLGCSTLKMLFFIQNTLRVWFLMSKSLGTLSGMHGQWLVSSNQNLQKEKNVILKTYMWHCSEMRLGAAPVSQLGLTEVCEAFIQLPRYLPWVWHGISVIPRSWILCGLGFSDAFTYAHKLCLLWPRWHAFHCYLELSDDDLMLMVLSCLEWAAVVTSSSWICKLPAILLCPASQYC